MFAVLTRRLLTVSFLLAVLAVAAPPAQACTVGMPGRLVDVVGEWGWSQEDGGIYEQETIAWAPPILIRDTATASVVTRFWGRPPANVGVQYEGGEWLSVVSSYVSPSSCEGILDQHGNLVAPDVGVGRAGYGMAPPPENNDGPLSPEETAAQGTVPFHRTAPILVLENGTSTGALSANEVEILEAAYGPATVLEIPFASRAQATFVVWWPALLAFALAAVATRGVMYIIRTHRSREATASSSQVSTPLDDSPPGTG